MVKELRAEFPFDRPTIPWNKKFHENPALQHRYQVFGFKIMEPFLKHKENDTEKWLQSHLYYSYIYVTKNRAQCYFKVTT